VQESARLSTNRGKVEGLARDLALRFTDPRFRDFPTVCEKGPTTMFVRCSRFLILLTLVMGACSRPVAAQNPSAPVFNPANGHWYQLVRVPGQINWPDARDAAAALYFAGYRGHLATVTSADEQQFINTNVTDNSGLESVWLGGYQEPDRGWRWVTSEPFQFTNWHAGEPNDSPHDSLALELAVIWGGQWDDRLAPLAVISGYVVEYEPPATPGAPRLGILPNPVIGGQTSVGQVTLDRPAAPGDVMVALGSSNPAVASVPMVVIVPFGATTTVFSIVTFPVTVATTVPLTATSASGSGSATVRVLPVGTSFPPGNLLSNGSFEQPALSPGTASATLTHATDLPGWRITRGSVDVVLAPTWQAAPGEGSQTLALAGAAGAGTIEQSFSTITGQEYLFSGWIAHNPNTAAAPEGRANVLLNGQFFDQLFHRDALATPADMRWSRFAYRFQATAAATTLTLADVTGTPSPGGLVLDGLTVVPVPTNLLVNGSFEEPVVAAGQTLQGGDLPGWQIASGSVALVPSQPAGWQPAPGQGSQSLDLVGGRGAGTIEQSFATEPGRLYDFSGWLSHAWGTEGGRANVYLDGELLTQLYHSNALYGKAAPADMRWQPFFYMFRATGPSTMLALSDISGPAPAGETVLDGLDVAPAEEPATGLPPAPPTYLTVKLISLTQIDLAWTNNSGDATQFEIQRKSPAQDWATIATVAGAITRFSDFGVSPNTSYSYRVRALNDSGASDWSNEATVTTLGGP
jgi:uncharacterized protein DUF642/fibronectin type III domain protein/lectin-like protein